MYDVMPAMLKSQRNEIVYDEVFAYLQIKSKGQIHLAKINQEDVEKVVGFPGRWHLITCMGKAYIGANYRDSDGKNHHMLLHRYLTNAPKGKDVDHIDGDGLNNSQENIRVCSRSENIWNKRIHKNNKVGEKNIMLRNDRYQIHIMAHGKQNYFGSYKTLEEAIEVRNSAVEKLHGIYARNN